MTEPIFETRRELCPDCLACVRACTLKAIRLTEEALEIDHERCIFCGACLSRCSQRAIRLIDQGPAVSRLISERPTVAILAPEFAAALGAVSLSAVESALRQLGFHAVEESLLAEEIVAREYLKLLTADLDKPLIRSTCPAITLMIQRYAVAMLPYLAPLASPMIVQGRLVKASYGDVATVFIGPCVARKAEAQDRSVAGAIDAVLTFGELKGMLAQAGIVLAVGRQMVDVGARVAVTRQVSTAGGFPRQVLTDSKADPQALVVARGVGMTRELLHALSRGEVDSRFVDILSCDGCLSGPTLGSPLSIFARKQIIRLYDQQRAVSAVSLSDLERDLPPVDTYRGFTAQAAALPLPSDEELAASLAGVGISPEDQFDCGGCGYDTCREQAIAVYQGFADWRRCFPYQRQLLTRTTEELKKASNTDSLTGLANHRCFMETLKAEFNRVQRYHVPLSLIMIDVDYFKEVNDRYGHLQGDRVLKLVADLLRDNLRESDLAARYGGDEFAIILPETGAAEAHAVAEKLRLLASKTMFWLSDEQSLKMSLSLGVCGVGADDADTVTVLTRADKALYSAKEAGRNRSATAK